MFVRGLIVSVTLMLLLVVAACGSENGPAAGAPSTPDGNVARGEPALEPTVCDCKLSDSAVLATATAEAARGPSPPLSVSVFEFGYTPGQMIATAGAAVTISLRNTGTTAHTFTISGVVDQRVLAGTTTEVRFTAPSRSGPQTFFCTVHGRDAMSGTLTVTP
jgi:plastocyanin